MPKRGRGGGPGAKAGSKKGRGHDGDAEGSVTDGVTEGPTRHGGTLGKVVYRLEGGLRHVEPYEFDFTTFVKRRWVGRTLIDVFTSEFIAYPKEYYEASIKAGHITVDGRSAAEDQVLRDGQRIVHRAVRCRENPVLDRGRIPTVADTDGMLVVSKPSSLPIHPCGSYRHNSLISVLREQGAVAPETKLLPTHRLDRLTSGLVLLAKTKDVARQIGAWFVADKIRKTYLARVRGSFARVCGPDAASLPGGASRADGGFVKVCGYIHCIDRKVGRHEFLVEEPPPGGIEPAKWSETLFEVVGEDEARGESVVRCFPRTGRTHQIRVHLQQLGLPIANDTCYGGRLDIGSVDLPLIPHEQQEHDTSPVAAPAAAGAAVGEGEGPASPPSGPGVPEAEVAVAGASAAPEASEAAGGRQRSPAVLHPSGIFLHALVYSMPEGVMYESEPPEWATVAAADPQAVERSTLPATP